MPKQTWKTLAPQLRLVWQLSLPAILTQITTIAMQYIDSAMVGALGADASAAIGLVASSTWLFGGVTTAVSAGFSVQVAHRIGAGEDTEARTVVRHGLAAALTLAALLALLGLGICRKLPCWLGGGASVFQVCFGMTSSKKPPGRARGGGLKTIPSQAGYRCSFGSQIRTGSGPASGR